MPSVSLLDKSGHHICLLPDFVSANVAAHLAPEDPLRERACLKVLFALSKIGDGKPTLSFDTEGFSVSSRDIGGFYVDDGGEMTTDDIRRALALLFADEQIEQSDLDEIAAHYPQFVHAPEPAEAR